MKIALFVEGQSDKETLTILVKKILGEHASVIPRVFRGKGNLLNEQKVYSSITYLVQEHPDVSKIIVCVDSECTPEDQTEQEIKKVEKSIKSKIQQRHPVYYVGVIHALEGWLLADPDAVTEHLGPKMKVNIPHQATLDCKPKEVIKDIFRKADKEFIALLHNPRIAEKIDIDKMANQNKSFARFRERIKDP